MKFKKTLVSLAVFSIFSFSAMAEEVKSEKVDSSIVSEKGNIETVKENMKNKFEKIYNFNSNISFNYLPDAKIYEIDLGKQKAYTNKDVDYIYLQGQIFVSRNGEVYNLTMPPEEFLKANKGASVNASTEVAETKEIAEQKTYNGSGLDAYQRSLSQSDNIENKKIALNLKYVGFEGGGKFPDNTKDYVKEIDLNNALKVVYGNGSRTVILFADPDCPFCQNFDKTLYLNADSLDATFYILPWALSIHPDAEKKIDFIWGQPDKENAWKSWMLFAAQHPVKDNPEFVWSEWIKTTGRTDTGKSEAPTAKTKELIEKFGLRYTPTILMPNGGISEGDIEADKLKQYLSVYDKAFPNL